MCPGYIAAARRGLTETEILEVLYGDSDYAKPASAVSTRGLRFLHFVEERERCAFASLAIFV